MLRSRLRDSSYLENSFHSDSRGAREKHNHENMFLFISHPQISHEPGQVTWMNPKSRSGSIFQSPKGIIGKYFWPKQVTPFITALFTVDKKWEQSECPLTGEWI